MILFQQIEKKFLLYFQNRHTHSYLCIHIHLYTYLYLLRISQKRKRKDKFPFRNSTSKFSSGDGQFSYENFNKIRCLSDNSNHHFINLSGRVWNDWNHNFREYWNFSLIWFKLTLTKSKIRTLQSTELTINEKNLFN